MDSQYFSQQLAKETIEYRLSQYDRFLSEQNERISALVRMAENISDGSDFLLKLQQEYDLEKNQLSKELKMRRLTWNSNVKLINDDFELIEQKMRTLNSSFEQSLDLFIYQHQKFKQQQVQNRKIHLIINQDDSNQINQQSIDNLGQVENPFMLQDQDLNQSLPPKISCQSSEETFSVKQIKQNNINENLLTKTIISVESSNQESNRLMVAQIDQQNDNEEIVIELDLNEMNDSILNHIFSEIEQCKIQIAQLQKKQFKQSLIIDKQKSQILNQQSQIKKYKKKMQNLLMKEEPMTFKKLKQSVTDDWKQLESIIMIRNKTNQLE